MRIKNPWVSEFTHILLLAAPIMITNALSSLLNIEDQIFLGHLGTEELAGAAIGNTYFSMVWMFLYGSATAVDTLVSQAFGTGDRGKVTFWTNQGYLALSILNIPSAVLLYVSPWVTEHVLRQDPKICELAGLYCRLQIPGLLFLSAFTVLQKSQQAQNNVAPSVWVALLANVFNVLGNYGFIWVLGFGYAGSPIATSLSRVISFFLLVVITWCYPPPSSDAVISTHEPLASYGAVDDFSKTQPSDLIEENEDNCLVTTLRGLRQFFLLGLPGGCMLLFESWSFLIIVVESGLLGVQICAASQVLMAYCSTMFLTFGQAVGSAGTIRVGNLCGAQQPAEAKIAGLICIAMGSLLMFSIGLCTFLGRFLLGPVFSNDPEVWDLIAHLAPLAGLFAIFDGFQACCSAVLRAIGRQFQCAMIYGMGFWVFGVPGGAVLCFWYGMGVFGLWWGILTGLVWVCLLSILVLARVDWKQEAARAWETTQVHPVKHEHSV